MRLLKQLVLCLSLVVCAHAIAEVNDAQHIDMEPKRMYDGQEELMKIRSAKAKVQHRFLAFADELRGKTTLTPEQMDEWTELMEQLDALEEAEGPLSRRVFLDVMVSGMEEKGVKVEWDESGNPILPECSPGDPHPACAHIKDVMIEILKVLAELLRESEVIDKFPSAAKIRKMLLKAATTPENLWNTTLQAELDEELNPPRVGNEEL